MKTAIFPGLKGLHSGIVNIDELTRTYRENNPSVDPKVFLNPTFIDTLLQEYHRRENIQWSYGGYLENRSSFLAESYLKASGNFLHLGVDVNLPAGTAIASTVAAKVLLVDNDHDVQCGWGPRVVLQPLESAYSHLVIIYAHLQAPGVVANDHLHTGEVFAEIGAAPRNGNWFEHLHIQTVLREHLENFKNWPEELDGYGHPTQIEDLTRIFPDPTWLLGLDTSTNE